MIVDVHTHLPSHRDSVPPSEMKTDTEMRSGETVQLTNSIDDYLKSIEPVDKAFLLALRHGLGCHNGQSLEWRATGRPP